MTSVKQEISQHQEVVSQLSSLESDIKEVGHRMVVAIQNGGKVLWMGNGGSAADSQHLAAELVGRFRRDRQAVPSIALTTDTSILSAVGNDYGYDVIFERQVEALCGESDVVVGISTSGNSTNVTRAIRCGREKNAYTVGLTGDSGGELAECVDVCLAVPSDETARIQEMHILIGHILCSLIETTIFDDE